MSQKILIIISLICPVIAVLIFVSDHFEWVAYHNFDRPLCIFFFGLAFFIGKKWMKPMMEKKKDDDVESVR